MMGCRILFCTAVSLALLTVILLAFFSPVPRDKNQSNTSTTRPRLALSLYIQQPQVSSSEVQPAVRSEAGAFIFHRKLTEGLENTSRVIGKAQGFIIPVENFAYSGFNIIHLTFDAPDYSGSLSVQAKHLEHKDREELTVVGGTGSFAFARGLAVFSQTGPRATDHVDGTFHVKLQLQLRFPDRSHTHIPG
uniref:Dirigent protein n=1 Tax=Salix viminalis TaxID=40686 RepID=A0A6N2MU23_SALVM